MAAFAAGPLGLLGLVMNIFLPMAYDTGPGRTDWITSLGTGIPALVQLSALVIILIGWTALAGRTKRHTAVGLKMVMIGVWIGSTALLTAVALVTYDFG